MPIYGKTLTPPPWVLETKLGKQKILILRRIFDKALKEDDTGVAQTLIKNEKEYNKPYLYTFDATKYPGPQQNYAYHLETIINRANEYLKKEKMFNKHYNDSSRNDMDYRFDIMGNWSFGNIIIMKRSDMLETDYKRQVKEYEKKVKKVSRTIKDDLL